MKTAIALLFAALATAQNAADAFRKGVVEEESNHNLTAAIQSYDSALKQAGGDRAVAANALFRMAECYRKLGKNDEAIAAYRRVAQEYADQTKLAEQSRKHLPAATTKAEALKSYRGVLEKAIDAAKKNLDYVQAQYKLGAVSDLDLYEPKRLVAQLESELAAFDAGMTQRQPPGPKNPQTAEARQRYRKLLEQERELAQKSYLAARLQYELGTMSLNDLVVAQVMIYNAELKLYAFDAGLAPPPPISIGGVK